MKKITFLFALLCASVMGFAQTWDGSVVGHVANVWLDGIGSATDRTEFDYEVNYRVEYESGTMTVTINYVTENFDKIVGLVPQIFVNGGYKGNFANKQWSTTDYTAGTELEMYLYFAYDGGSNGSSHFNYTIPGGGSTPDPGETPVSDPNDYTASGHTIHLDASYVGDIYTLVITSTDNMDGLGGSFWHVNGENTDMRANTYTVSGDKKTITCQVQSTSAPDIYTPLFVMMPGEVTFNGVTLNWEDRTPINSEYCNYQGSETQQDGHYFAITFETDPSGNVVITIGDGTGAGACSFRNGGFEGSNNGLVNFVVSDDNFATTTDAANYFTVTRPSDGDLQYILTKKADLPANAKIKHLSAGAIAWREAGVDRWCFPEFIYTYGGTCNQLDAPTNVAVSSDSVITFDAVTGAAKYIAYVTLGGVEKYHQEVASGDKLHFIPYVDGDYDVTIIASGSGKVDSDPSAAYVWSLTAVSIDLGNSEYCEHPFGSGNAEAAITWETNDAGSIVITIIETLGGAADETNFRNTVGLNLNNFKVGAGKVAGSDYFNHSGQTVGNQITLSLKNPANAPALGEKIYYDGYVEYSTSKASGQWPTLQFEYTYGTVCSGKSVSATPNNNTMGTAVVKKDDDVVTNVEVGDEVSFIATVADAELYRFVNWTKGGVEVSTSATYVTTITESTNLIANFDYIRNTYCHTEINSVQNKKLYLTLGSIGGGQYQIKIEGSAEAKLTGLNNANYTINWVTTDIEDGDKKMSGQDVPFSNARWAFDESGYGSATAVFGISEGKTWEDIYVWNHAIYFSTAEGEVGYTGFPGRHNIAWTATCADEIDPVLVKAEGEVLNETSVRLKVQATDNWEGILTYTISRAGAEDIVLHGASGEELTQDVTGLTTGTEYTFTVLVEDAAGNNDIKPIVITPVGDETKPVMGEASLASKTWNSAIINVTATDNKGVTAYYVVELDAEFVPAEGKITVEGLTQATAYTFNIKAKDAAGNISDNQAEVNFTTDAHALVPTTAAPVPTWPADQVKSIYSDTYAFAPASLNSYNEGWWDNPNMNEGEISGDHYLHYDLYRNGMIGWQYGEISVASLEKLHIDIFASKAGSVTIRPITNGDPEEVNNVRKTLNLTANQWNSFDIALTDFPGHDWTKLFQFSIENYQAGGLVGEHISVDNVYFYRETPIEDDEKPTNVSANAQVFFYSLKLTVSAEDNSGDVHFVVMNGENQVAVGDAVSGVATTLMVNNLTPGTDYSLNVIASDAANNEADPVIVVATTLAAPGAAPAPTHEAKAVKSIYSEAYESAIPVGINFNEWWWQAPSIAQEVSLGGNNARYYGGLSANGVFGITWSGDHKLDAAGYQKVHFHIYPTNSATIEIYPVIQPEGEFHKVSQELVGGQWNEVVLDYSDKTFAPFNQFGIVYTEALGDFFIDNLYFYSDPDYARDGLTVGNYGTICLPQAGDIVGATLYEIADYANNMIYVDEVEGGVMEAAKPYIFQATSDKLNVYYTSATVEETAGSANGLHGFYNLENENAQFDIEQDAGNYILYQNQYWLVSGRAAYINNFRAYIKIGEINYTAPSPSRRRVAMTVNGEQTATGMDAINATDAPVKMVINGQLFILRGEKMYDTTGRLVK